MRNRLSNRRGFMEEQRTIKRKQMHKQKLELLRRTKRTQELVGPSIMATGDGGYMQRFTGLE